MALRAVAAREWGVASVTDRSDRTTWRDIGSERLLRVRPNGRPKLDDCRVSGLNPSRYVTRSAERTSMTSEACPPSGVGRGGRIVTVRFYDAP